MIFIPSPGVAFLIPYEKKEYHLHFILTPPLRRKNIEEVLVIGITSTKVDPDFTLTQSDHPFIKHKSYINYPRARIISVEHIKKNLEINEYKRRGVADKDVAEYICRGLLDSRHSLPQHRKFYREAWGLS